MPECRKIISWIEEWVLPSYAEEGDRIGLQVGGLAQPVQRVMVTLEVTAAVVEEAVERGVQLIVAHHPLIYHPMTNVSSDHYPGQLIGELMKNELSFYAAHTNLDAAPGGVNDLLADLLGLEKRRVLYPTYRERNYKLAVFVPDGYQDQVREAICAAGAGGEGNYGECTFRGLGTGTFRPHQGADPFIGQVGKLSEVAEYRLETIVPENKIAPVIKAMLRAHPYQEVAYDLYPLSNEERVFGLGRIGELPEPVCLADLARLVKEKLELPVIKATGDPRRLIRRVALCGGSAMELMPQALAAGADLFLTGDIKHHPALEAAAEGMALLDAGHYGSERIVVPALANYLRERASQESERVQIFISDLVTDPFFYL